MAEFVREAGSDGAQPRQNLTRLANASYSIRIPNFIPLILVSLSDSPAKVKRAIAMLPTVLAVLSLATSEPSAPSGGS
jgi:NMD protein affecting ribosome stability and mRNA decay